MEKFLALFNYTHAYFISETSDEFYSNMYKVSKTILTNANKQNQYTMKFQTLSQIDGRMDNQISLLLQDIRVSSRGK